VKPTIPFEDYSKNPDQFNDQPATLSKMAVIDPRAKIGRGVEIGPFCVIGPNVTIGENCRLANNVTITGHVKMGRNNQCHPGVVIGGEPQDIRFSGAETRVEIGDNNIFRECVTINRGSEKEKRVTRIGSNCFLMGCCHIGHDCIVGDNLVMANGSMLGGHVICGDGVTLSGAVGVHQFATIGNYAFIGGISRVLHDIPPFMLADGNPARPRCVNVVALKRNDFPTDTIRTLTEAYRLLFRSRVGLENAREILRNKVGNHPDVEYLLNSIEYQQAGRHGRGGEQRRRAA
jgi:UDP-N-acetylglucosamine acyltransferase